MAAPRPKPSALKLVAGNPGKRKINKNEPKPRRVIPACPSHLSGVAKEAWKKLSVLLDNMGVLTEADALALERMCDCYADVMESRALIEKEGRTYSTRSQAGDTLLKGHPAVGQLRAADAQLKSYMIEFGLTPSARSKLHVDNSQNDGKKDPLSEFFG